MAMRVLIREFAGSDQTAAVKEVSAEMFDLPEVGSRYWRGGLPYTVRGIAEGDPAVVDLVLDRARSQEVDQERLGHHSSAFTMDTYAHGPARPPGRGSAAPVRPHPSSLIQATPVCKAFAGTHSRVLRRGLRSDESPVATGFLGRERRDSNPRPSD